MDAARRRMQGRWEPWHCILVMRQRGYLMGSVWFKLWRAAALRSIGPDHVAKLRYDDGGQDFLGTPPGAEGKRWIAALQDLAPAVEALATLAGPEATDGGSNNWAVAPLLTATGRPLLAGDPHRAFEMPSLYSQFHLACDAFDAIGLSVPGVPAFPHFAHNGHVAFCVTHAFHDAGLSGCQRSRARQGGGTARIFFAAADLERPRRNRPVRPPGNNTTNSGNISPMPSARQS
jgi:penicillin amidase